MPTRHRLVTILVVLAASAMATPAVTAADWTATTTSAAPAVSGESKVYKFRLNKQDKTALESNRQARQRRRQAQAARRTADRYAQRIARIESLLARAEADELRLRASLEQRVVEIYKHGDASLAQVFGASGLDGAINRLALIARQSERDASLASDHGNAIAELEELKQLLEDLQDAQASRAVDLDSRATMLESQVLVAREAHVYDIPDLRRDAGVDGRWMVVPVNASFMSAYSSFNGTFGAKWDGGTRTPARAATPGDIAAVLGDMRIDIYAGGRTDILEGRVDGRLLNALKSLADRFGSVTVTSLINGHGYYTASGNVSMHSYGCAVDIGSLSGTIIQSSTQGPGSITEKGVKFLAGLQGDLTPHQVISLYSYGGPTLALGDHDDHIHLGYSC